MSLAMSFRNLQSPLSIKSMLPLLSLLFSFALLINSVITFAEATPLPPGIPRVLETSGFELCLQGPTSGFLFRVGFYDPQTDTTTKSGPGVLVLCIGTNNCFGYTTTTTTMTTIAAPGTQHTVGTVIHTGPRRRSKKRGIYAPAYQELQITPNCDKFNHWSPTPPPHAHDLGYNEPGTTLVELLKNIENLQSALHDHARANPNLDITVAIDSPVSYILAVLDYLYSKGMLITYDKPSILDTISLPTKMPGPSRLSWGFLESKSEANRQRWLKFPNIQSGKTFLCFGVSHCFGLDNGRVRDILPMPSKGSLDGRYFYRMINPRLYPSFNLQKFEECLKTSVFLTKLTGHSDEGGIRFADIPHEEIRQETGVQENVGEDEDSFYFRVLLRYMMVKGIIEKYNPQTHAQMRKALEFAKAGKMDATVAKAGKMDAAAAKAAKAGKAGKTDTAVAAAVALGSDSDFHQPPPAVGTSLDSTGSGSSTHREEAAHAQAGVVAAVHSSHGDNTVGGGAVKPYAPRISVSSLLQNRQSVQSN
ncbi:hypothetical protein C8J55DRAFT_606647 [Lentinula edodes]|uniref:Uncharacterized protein n=1 Tax=Lentinula lateritia TaxID=40482 RepID=A0A9W9AB06_9AGAR|nr:hypothetical protein C8J55DRAFT_606647 [Lentinula edodes]